MSSRRIQCDVPLNRVEGDLEVSVAVEDGQVAEAWSRGTLFRGFERMLVDRAPLDSLVVTPRICGICSTTHLAAAAKALDQVTGVTPPDNGVRMRNAALMAEQIQSDLRQSLLMFLVDFANPAYEAHSLGEAARQRYAPVGGDTPPGSRCVSAVRETRRILELVALVGGQWPHSSFMVPGGVVYGVGPQALQQGRHLVRELRRWYEDQVLGCSLERWQAVQSMADLEAWLAESAAHRESDAGFLIRFAREAGLDGLGGGPGNFLSCGSLDLPVQTTVRGRDGRLVPAGFARGTAVEAFHEGRIAEHTAWSWYDDPVTCRHPRSGQTEPMTPDPEGARYTWAKAARYNHQPAETGPLAERIVAGDPLFTDWVNRDGPNLLARQLARLTRPATLFDSLDAWLKETMEASTAPFYESFETPEEGHGTGLVQAARGALGHWVRVEEGRIAHYQVVTPTGWNGSPRDADDTPGPWEQALVGTPVPDTDNPVTMGHVVRSFDPCLVCTVHQVGGPSVKLGV